VGCAERGYTDGHSRQSDRHLERSGPPWVFDAPRRVSFPTKYGQVRQPIEDCWLALRSVFAGGKVVGAHSARLPLSACGPLTLPASLVFFVLLFCFFFANHGSGGGGFPRHASQSLTEAPTVWRVHTEEPEGSDQPLAPGRVSADVLCRASEGEFLEIVRGCGWNKPAVGASLRRRSKPRRQLSPGRSRPKNGSACCRSSNPRVRPHLWSDAGGAAGSRCAPPWRR